MLGHRTLNVEDYLTILKRRWWVICIPAVIVPIIAVGSTYFLTPQYESTSLILIDQQKVSSDVVKPLDLGGLQSQLAIITAQIESRSTIDPIITKYNLYASQHLSMEARADLVRKNLVIAPIETQIDRANGLPGFKVIFTADDPHTAQEVCSDITGLYTRNSLLNQQNMTTGTTEFIQSQLNEEKRKLDDMDQKKAQFEAKYMGSLPGDEANNSTFLSSLSSRMDSLNQQIASLQQNKTMQETMLAQLTQQQTPAVASAKVEAADQVQLDKLQDTLHDLQSRYSDDYPDVKETKREIADLKAQMAKEAAAPAPAPAAPAPHVDSMQVVQLRTSIRLIQESIDEKTKEQQQLQAQMRSYEGRIALTPEVEEQYNEITRDYQTELANYNKLLAQMNQSQMATALQDQEKGETFTVLDMASLPVDATFPKQSVFAMGGLGGGIVLGVLIVAFQEYRDTALRSERDIWAFTQLPTLAVIAYSVDDFHDATAKPGLLRRLFTRKPKELLAG